MSSRPFVVPGKQFTNSAILGANALSMVRTRASLLHCIYDVQAGFLSMAPATPLIAAGYLAASTALSFIQGVTTTAAIGGADMRSCVSSIESNVFHA